MASLLNKLWVRFRTKKVPISLMIVGLDNSGKSSILNQLALLNQASKNGDQRKTIEASYSRIDEKESSSIMSIHDGNPSETTNAQHEDSSIMPTVGYNYERLQYKGLTITVLDFSGQSRYRNLWQEFYSGVDAIVFVIDSSDLIRFVVARDELEIMLSHPYFSSLVGVEFGDPNGNQQQQQQLSPIQQLQLQQQSTPQNPHLTVQKQITISQGKLIQSPLVGSAEGHDQSGGRRGRRNRVPILFLANKADLASSVDIEVIVKALNLTQLPANRHPWHIQATSVNLNQGISEAFDWLLGQLSVAS